MFERLGGLTVRHWPAVLAVWAGLVVALLLAADPFNAHATPGEFAFLPEDSSSVQAERLFAEAFPSAAAPRSADDEGTGNVQQNPLGSNLVLLVYRADPLTDADYAFIDEHLVPAIRARAEAAAGGPSPVQGVWTYLDKKIGPLLVSEDKHATLVVIELAGEFLDRSNEPLIDAIEELTRPDSPVAQKAPVVLALTISGSATVGRDMLRAESESAERTEFLTFVLVIGLLVAIYRAPLLALIPLATVAAATLVALRGLSWLAEHEYIGLFQGLAVYIRVVMYGAGVDYCLFIIARYRENLYAGRPHEEALSHAVHRTGPALAASAGTSILGIGMMMAAEFGKFRQAGFGIAVGLAVVLVAAMTFAPAVLAMFRRAAFWPTMGGERPAEGPGVVPGPVRRAWGRVRPYLHGTGFWRALAMRIEGAPLTFFLVTLLAMAPFAAVAPTAVTNLSYGLLSDLPSTDASVVGAKAIQRYFPAGVAGPVSVLVENPDFADEGGRELSERVTDALREDSAALRLADIRSQARPLGLSTQSERFMESLGTNSRGMIARKNILRQARNVYLSGGERLDGQVLRFDLIFDRDPFSRDSIATLDQAEATIRDALPTALREGTRVLMIGPTASIRDLKAVTDRDAVRIRLGVCLVVYVVIVALLRMPRVCLFLLASVIVSYLATVGATYLAFRWWQGADFAGLDWKVPIFLFTLLIALGEDYNILLMSRVAEERRRLGPVEGVREAMARTGGIISSCGLIMAATFASLMSASLMGMAQMGFALCVGVLLDTFVVRPILVPAWLLLIQSDRLGKWGPLLGGREFAGADPPPATESPV